MEQVIKTEAAEIDDDQLLEHCRDFQANVSGCIKNEPIEDNYQQNDETGIFNVSEFIKNEPIEDDKPSIEYSAGEATHSAIYVKDEGLSIESEEQKITETNFKTYRVLHAEDKPYECPYCAQRFIHRSSMYRHRQTHERVPQEACDICGKSFGKSQLKRHKLIHSDENVHECDFCKKRFTTRKYLRNHIRKHTGEKPYKCKYCERSFNDPSHRIKHMRIHLGDNIYRCVLCPLAFRLAKELSAHLTEHSNDDSETRERNMKALKGAEAKLQLKLSETKTQQPSKENLRTYRFMHGEDKPYGCPYCPRRFNDNANMHRHKEIHEGVKRVACDICGKSILKRSLKTHKLIHGKEKAYKCDICEMSFARISNLRTHMRKHTGEKPYKCKYCERSFSYGNDRMIHMRLHLGDNVHRCKLCPLAFPLVKELCAHLTEHNNDDAETRERNMKALKEAEAKLQLELSKKETLD